MTNEYALEILMDAVSKDCMRDAQRSYIAYLYDSMEKNKKIFENIPNIIQLLINAITDQLFDCWAVYTNTVILHGKFICFASWLMVV